jgi:hypothetical protein
MIANDLLSLSRSDLMDLLRGGHPIDPRALDDTEYHGVSLGLPGVVERLTWKNFKKTFHRDPSTGLLRGWNIRVSTGKAWGHYQVVAPRHRKLCDRGLLIDYGKARLRDPIVALAKDDPTLLLGWTYVDLGFTQMGTPSFFSLTRGGPLSHVVSDPHAPTA